MRPGNRSWLNRAIRFAATPLAGALALGAHANAQSGLSAERVAPLRVCADRQQVGPGETVRLAVVFDLAPKWHVYWKDPGEGGIAPRIRVTAPAGFRVGAPLFTRPRAFATPLGEEFGYSGETVIFVPVTAPASLADGHAAFEVAVDWAVCKEVCLLGRARRELVLETARQRPDSPGAVPAVIRRHEQRLPKPLGEVAGATVRFDGSTLRLEGPASGRDRVAFFPERRPGVTFGDIRATVRDDRFEITAAVEVNPNNALAEPMAIAGLVALGERPDEPCYDFTLTIDE